MSPLVTEQLRQELHATLDLILDERARIEVPPEGETGLNALLGLATSPRLNGISDAPAADRLFQLAIKFARDVMGGAVHNVAFHRTYNCEHEQRRVLRGWLLAMLPLLEFQPKTILGGGPLQELTFTDVLEALSALDAGEIQPLFQANTGKARRANRYSLARRKVEALFWKKRLKALGHHDKAANFEITKAFGEQWDTIRKWRGQCEEILGRTYVHWGLEHAGSDRDLYVRPAPGIFGGWKPNAKAGLEQAGQAYRIELQRSSDLSKRKSRATPEK